MTAKGIQVHQAHTANDFQAMPLRIHPYWQIDPLRNHDDQQDVAANPKYSKVDNGGDLLTGLLI
jgi:hypothetical protein